MTLEIGHYTAHAIPSLLATAEQCSRTINDGGYTADRLRALVRSIQEATKFFLPDGGVLFDTDYNALPEVLHLPFNDMVIEHSDRAMGVYGRRIIYLHEENDQIQMTPIFFDAKSGNWAPFYASANIVSRMHGARPGFEWGWWTVRAQEYLGNVTRSIENHLHDCGRVVLSLIEVLQCSNVTTEKVPPPAALNKKRERSGKVPFDSYHVLKIPSGPAGSGESAGGSHASPRQHLRRGHIRRLASGKTTWVNATIVGSAKNGTVTKDYLISR